MRIIAGAYKGRKLVSPGVSFIRPTSDRTKQFIFDYLGDKIESAYVLDLYSGTGNLGIEALSRGAESVVFVDREKKAGAIMKKNLNLIQCQNRAKVIIKDTLNYLNIISHKNINFDIILADPPYNYVIIDELLKLVCQYKILGSDGIFVLEHSTSFKIESSYENLITIKSRRIGDTTVSIFKENEESKKYS